MVTSNGHLVNSQRSTIDVYAFTTVVWIWIVYICILCVRATPFTNISTMYVCVRCKEYYMHVSNTVLVDGSCDVDLVTLDDFSICDISFNSLCARAYVYACMCVCECSRIYVFVNEKLSLFLVCIQFYRPETVWYGLVWFASGECVCFRLDSLLPSVCVCVCVCVCENTIYQNWTSKLWQISTSM